MENSPEKEPRWLTRRMLDAFHADQLRQHGGTPGVHDEGMIESPLARPRHRFQYGEEADLADFGAAYAFGLAKNHGYVDGNKRIAFMALYVFLGLNGKRLIAPESEVVEVMTGMASGALNEAELTTWVRENIDESG